MTRVKSIIDQFELNDKSGVDPTHEPHPIFTELEELCVSQDSDDLEWKETARFDSKETS